MIQLPRDLTPVVCAHVPLGWGWTPRLIAPVAVAAHSEVVSVAVDVAVDVVVHRRVMAVGG